MKIASNVHLWVGIACCCWEESIVSGITTPLCLWWRSTQHIMSFWNVNRACSATSIPQVNIDWILHFWHHRVKRKLFCCVIQSTRHCLGGQWPVPNCGLHCGHWPSWDVWWSVIFSLGQHFLVVLVVWPVSGAHSWGWIWMLCLFGTNPVLDPPQHFCYSLGHWDCQGSCMLFHI